VFIDGNKLTQYAPPPVGTPILSVQGIVNQATRGYRIMLRNGNDIVVNTPPNVTDAYPVLDNVIKVIFDRDVTNASATTLTNYSLASFGSIDGVVMSGTSAVLVTMTNGLSHGDIEVLTVNGVVGVAAGQAMTTPQSRTFVNGLLTAEEVQRANPDSPWPVRLRTARGSRVRRARSRRAGRHEGLDGRRGGCQVRHRVLHDGRRKAAAVLRIRASGHAHGRPALPSSGAIRVLRRVRSSPSSASRARVPRRCRHRSTSRSAGRPRTPATTRTRSSTASTSRAGW
jgi:hypothetical protein